MTDRSSPVDDVQSFLERLTRRLETAARSWETELDSKSRLNLSAGDAGTSLDLADTGDAFVVTLDVPGYEAADLESRIAGDTLSISGERAQTTDRDGEDYIRRERSIQSFSRQVRLPEPVDAESVDATLNNGILTIELSKATGDEDGTTIDID